MDYYLVTSRRTDERGFRQGQGQTGTVFCRAYRLSQFLRSTLLAFGLMFFLAACGTIEADRKQSSISDQASPEIKVTQPATASFDGSVEETVGQEEVVLTVTPTEEANIIMDVATTEPQNNSQEIVPPEQTTIPEGSTTEVVSTETVINHQSPIAEQLQLLTSLPLLGSPPELHNEVWLNSEPLQLADLRGKVVIVEFWTFG